MASPSEEEASSAAAAQDPLLPADQQLADAVVRGMGLGLTTKRSTAATDCNPSGHGTGAIRRTPSTSSEEEEDSEDLEDQELVPPTDLTSVDGSELYSDIRQLLARQQHNSVAGSLDGISSGQYIVGDGYDLEAFNQINGVWPLGHPLPLPDWSSSESEGKGTLVFDNVWQYEELNGIVETTLQRMLEETHYNTVNLFVDFYRSFKRTRRSDLRSFFQFYDVPINRRHHMCVSLAFEIMARMVRLFPVLANYLYVVSCEEQVMDCQDYLQLDDLNSVDAGVEKEHVMVAMRIAIGERRGVMILDPGYHVSRAVTVMQDQSYPHTGWFTQSKEPHLQRDYCYAFSQQNGKFVEWKEREIRGDDASFKTSLVYVEQEYITAIDVTVRRNLVYNFRSLLSRDAKGQVYAGIYFPLVANSQEAYLTIFYDGPNEQRVRTKLMFSAFKVGKGKLPDYVAQHLSRLAPQLKMPLPELTELCKSLAEVVTDQNFVSQVLAINNDIGNMSVEN